MGAAATGGAPRSRPSSGRRLEVRRLGEQVALVGVHPRSKGPHRTIFYAAFLVGHATASEFCAAVRPRRALAGADGAAAPARSAASTPGSTAAGSRTPPSPRTWPSSPRSAASPMKRSPVITASRRSRSRATAAAPARLVAGGEDGRRGPPPGTAAPGPGRARRRRALVVKARCAGADVADAADGDGILRHRPARQDEPGGRGRGTCGSVKGGVARAGCRRRGRAGGNRSGAADLAAVLVTYHRRGVAGRWRRVGEKIAREDDRLDAVIAKLLFMAGVSAPSAGTDCRRRRPTGSSRCSSSPHDRTANGVDGELAPRAGSREPAVDDLVVVGDGRRRTGPRPQRTAGGDRQVVAITGPKRSGRTRTC